MVEIQLYLRQEFVVFKIPGQLYYNRYKFKAKQKVDVLGVIAFLYKFFNNLLHLLVEDFTCHFDKCQIHVECELYCRDMDVLSTGTFPVEQNMA